MGEGVEGVFVQSEFEPHLLGSELAMLFGTTAAWHGIQSYSRSQWPHDLSAKGAAAHWCRSTTSPSPTWLVHLQGARGPRQKNPPT